MNATSARELARRVRDGALAPATLARETLARIEALEPGVGAFACTLDAASAERAALACRGPLQGVPVAVKDIFDTHDLPTAYGSPIHQPGRACAADAAVVALVRAAGGLVIGKSTTTEFAFLHPTATRNPRAPGRTPGGSSAGSAAAVAAGMVPLALGTQTGGSVIRPASYCGVVGYKPTFDWLPTAGLKCFSWSLDTVGLFAGNVDDAAWFAQALCGRALDDATPARPLRVGIVAGVPWGELSASASRALEQGRAALEAAGATTARCTLPPFAAAAFDAHAAVQGWEAARCLHRELEDHAAQLSPLLVDYLKEARGVEASAYEAAQQVAAQVRVQADEWLAGFDALLSPAAPDEAPLTLASTGPSTFNRAWTLLHVPCITVPGALGVNGAPMGLQLVGPRGADARVFAVASVLERALVRRGTA